MLFTVEHKRHTGIKIKNISSLILVLYLSDFFFLSVCILRGREATVKPGKRYLFITPNCKCILHVCEVMLTDPCRSVVYSLVTATQPDTL